MVDPRKHVVIVGGGFGGLEAAKRLRKVNVRVTVVDRHNYHLFQPLLYQVATGGLSPANIATPLRSILRKQRNCETAMAEVVDFELEQRRLILADDQMEYDILVVAAGSTHSYFGREEWAELAPGLKSIEDATRIRRAIYLAFEAAERETDPERRRQWMTFVVVGGGPTGVELAGAIAEIAVHTLRHDFRHIDPEDARILLVEAAPHVLANYPESLCMRAADEIRSLGIEVITHTKVTGISSDRVVLDTPDGEQIVFTKTVLWGAGVKANPLGSKLASRLGIETDRGGRVPVNEYLNVAGHENIYVIGDLAQSSGPDGKPLPGLAAVAMQQGAYVARAIAAQVRSNEQINPFRYQDKGSMATIGRAAAVAQIGERQFSGFFAWLLWLFVHLLLIVQFQNRLLILLQWAWNYLTFSRSARIITGVEDIRIVHPREEVKS